MNFYGCIVRLATLLFVANALSTNIEAIVSSTFEAVTGGESTKVIVGKLITDAKLEICKLEESVSSSKAIAEQVEYRAQTVSNEIRQTMRRHMAALEERERELLRRVEKVRQIKGKSLHLQIDELKTSLAESVERLRIIREIGRTEHGP